MKKAVVYLLSVFLVVILSSCSQNLTDKDDIISLFRQNEESFLEAAETEEYSELEKIRGIKEVRVWDEYVDIPCGGNGFGSGTHYYGIFFSATDNLCAVDVSGPAEELVAYENGYLYEQKDGDNRYYVEPLGNHYFYYEAHF